MRQEKAKAVKNQISQENGKVISMGQVARYSKAMLQKLNSFYRVYLVHVQSSLATLLTQQEVGIEGYNKQSKEQSVCIPLSGRYTVVEYIQYTSEFCVKLRVFDTLEDHRIEQQLMANGSRVFGTGAAGTLLAWL